VLSVPVIHRMWLGPYAMPAEYEFYAQRWRALNPGWVVKDWTLDELLDNPINGDVIEDLFRRDAGREGVEVWVQLADVLGYQVIYRHGGVYVNVDIEPVRSMGYLLEHYRVGHRAYAPYEDEGSLVVNAVLGGPEGHPFWERINEILPQRYWDMPGAEMNQVTGPHLLTELASSWNRNRSGDDEFVALAQESFNQVHWSQIPPGEDATGLGQDSPGVIGIHHWGHKKAGRTNYVESATQGPGRQ